jgi:sulfur-carrier protein
VKVFGGLRDSADRSSLRVPIRAGTTVDGLLSLLDATQPALADALRRGLSEGYLNVLVNGRNARFLTGVATVLADGDAVAFLPPIGGG